MTFNTMAQIVDFEEIRQIKRQRCENCNIPVFRNKLMVDGKCLCSVCAKKALSQRRNVIIFPGLFKANAPFGGAA